MVRTPDEAGAAFAEMDEAGCGAVIQELIPGGDDHIIAAHSYVASDGRMLGMVVTRKLRQNPPGFGCGSYYVTIDHPAAGAETSRLLAGLDFRGVAGTEFKIDARDGNLKLMEINPRPAAISSTTPASISPGCCTRT